MGFNSGLKGLNNRGPTSNNLQQIQKHQAKVTKKTHTNNVNRGLQMQPQIHTAGTRDNNAKQILL